MRNRIRKIFYVDWAMCGGEELPEDFDLEEFCEVLQGKVSDMEIVPITDPKELAIKSNSSAVLS